MKDVIENILRDTGEFNEEDIKESARFVNKFVKAYIDSYKRMIKNPISELLKKE